MKITDVKMRIVNEPMVKAYVTITLDGSFVIQGIKIIQTSTGLLAAMPSKRLKDGSYKDIAHPINSETRSYFDREILEAYRIAVKTQSEALNPVSVG